MGKGEAADRPTMVGDIAVLAQKRKSARENVACGGGERLIHPEAHTS